MADIRLPCKLLTTSNVEDDRFDGVVLVLCELTQLKGKLSQLATLVEQYAKIDNSYDVDVSVLHVPSLAAKRLILAPTGPVKRDYDDVRRFYDAAVTGLKRAVKAGCRSPLLVVPKCHGYKTATHSAILGALHALYVPLEIREDVPDSASKVDVLGVWSDNTAELDTLLKELTAIESGRYVCRDIGGSDPERMAAPNAARYTEELFKNTLVSVKVIDDLESLKKEYPLLSAVNRATTYVERHRGRVVLLEYNGAGTIDQTLLLVGKGITYDTGGADIKAGGVMAGMHRDKCGAATVVGFFQTLALAQPKGLRVLGACAFVRNSIGAECYVSDEIITSRAGVRVRVGNTDAEGRMVMADVLCQMKEKALECVNPHLFTIATLTGHAIRAVGEAYTLILDNGPAKKLKTSKTMQAAGELVGDMFEISTIRREDYVFHTGKSEYEDVLQCNNAPSTMTPRGHQSPAAFMIMASGLDKHGIDSEKPLPYSHLDIAGSSGPFPGVPTGFPIPALFYNYLSKRV